MLVLANRRAAVPTTLVVLKDVAQGPEDQGSGLGLESLDSSNTVTTSLLISTLILGHFTRRRRRNRLHFFSFHHVIRRAGSPECEPQITTTETSLRIWKKQKSELKEKWMINRTFRWHKTISATEVILVVKIQQTHLKDGFKLCCRIFIKRSTNWKLQHDETIYTKQTHTHTHIPV